MRAIKYYFYCYLWKIVRRVDSYFMSSIKYYRFGILAKFMCNMGYYFLHLSIKDIEYRDRSGKIIWQQD